MKWVEVSSRNLSAIGYDPTRRELGLRFRESGKTYIYLDVSADEYAAFMSAESKGSYLNQVFKPKGHSYRLEG